MRETTGNPITHQLQVDFTYRVALKGCMLASTKTNGLKEVIAVVFGTTADRYFPKAVKDHKIAAATA